MRWVLLILAAPWLLSFPIWIMMMAPALKPGPAFLGRQGVTGGLPDPGPPPPVESLRFREISTDRVVRYLESKRSALARPDRVEAIKTAAKRYDVNPLLLVAITGQEQSFVPRDQIEAEMIASNPFNVFGCWCVTYPQLTLEQSAAHAAETVARLSQGMPPGAHPIRWINYENGRGVYAEDPTWWIGVSFFFDEARREGG